MNHTHNNSLFLTCVGFGRAISKTFDQMEDALNKKDYKTVAKKAAKYVVTTHVYGTLLTLEIGERIFADTRRSISSAVNDMFCGVMTGIGSDKIMPDLTEAQAADILRSIFQEPTEKKQAQA